MLVLTPLLIGILGAVLASFAGVISERLNTGESWMRGRSRCNACDRFLTALDLVPVLSWVIARGGCRTCRASIPYRYALAEVLLAVVFAAAAAMLGLGVSLVLALAFFFLLLIIVLYDLRHTIVPLSLAFMLIGLAVLFLLTTMHYVNALSLAFLTAGAIATGFFLMHVLSGGRWMGLGDAPIALALTLFVGSQALAGLLFSFWIGGAIGIVILVATPKGHRMGIEIPFVPFLAAGYLLAFFTQWNPLPF